MNILLKIMFLYLPALYGYFRLAILAGKFLGMLEERDDNDRI